MQFVCFYCPSYKYQHIENIIFATDTMKITCTCSDGTYTLLNWKERRGNTFITHSGLVFNPLYFNDGYATGGKTKTEGRQIRTRARL